MTADVRVLVSDSLAEEGLEALRKLFAVEYRPKCTPEELLSIIPEFDALIVRSGTEVTAEVIQAGTRLKIVGRAGVGVNNIDLKAANERGIIVVNVPDGNTISATEHTFGMMLALARNIPQAHASMKAGEWERNRFMGVQLYNKVLGVVGLGRIGQEVAKRAAAFGMKVLGYDPYVTARQAAQIGVELMALDDLLPQCDFVTVHTPLIPATRGLINAERIARMKRGVRLINCARGGIIDEKALAQGLASGQIGGAALDVFEVEPPTDSTLMGFDQLIATPHLGASTEEAQVLNAMEIVKQVSNYFSGQPVRNAVNLPRIPEEQWESAQPLFILAECMGRFLIQGLANAVGSVRVLYRGNLDRSVADAVAHSALAGLLSEMTELPVNQINAMTLAERRGIRFESSRSEVEGNVHQIEIECEGDNERHHLTGEVLGNNMIRFTGVEGMPIDLAPTQRMLVTRHTDRPGIIGLVGSLLGERQINIGAMLVGRSAVRGSAIMVLALDDELDRESLEAIRNIPDLIDVRVVNLPERLVNGGH